MARCEVLQVVITRFNVPLASDPGRSTDLAWLEPRVALFEQYCAPSVMRQLSGSRRWLIVMNSETPLDVLAKVRRATAGRDVRVVFTSTPLNDGAQRSLLADDLRGPEHRLMTSRLDNDDALAGDYLDRVLDAASHSRPSLLVATTGFQLRGESLYSVRDPLSPFLTMAEPMGPAPTTAYCAPHHLVHRQYQLSRMAGEPSWLQVIHGDNIANAVRGVRTGLSRASTGFPHLAVGPERRDGRYFAEVLTSSVTATTFGAKRTLQVLRGRLRRAGEGAEGVTPTVPTDH